ncbi:hypothetical protein HY386_00345 [Candidatus Daviesbacteria bacterium]|nr:hypothetical protein [Candidatus Daviesbacteria bacterium]
MIRQKIVSLLAAVGLFLLAPLPVWAATLSLSPSTGTFNTNCPFSLDMVLDTQGAQTDGTDAILFYDTSRLTAGSITSGTIYPDYPGNNIDDSAGKITVSGLASVSQAFSGKGTLATVNFLVKQNAPTGATQIKFDFDPNDKTKTTDSNVVERGTVVDVLSSVVNGNYTIGTGTCGSQTVTGTGGPTIVTVPQGAVSTPSGAVKEPVTILPPAGSETFTYTIAILGTVLTVLGILGLALL